MRDLFILTADNTMTHVLRSFFKRSGFAHSLGCGSFSIDVLADIMNIPGFTDGGLHTRANELLLPYLDTHRHAIIMLDKHFGGERPANEVRTEIEENLQRSGWNTTGPEAAVVVIDPELEVWLWQDNIHVESALRALSGLRQKLQRDGIWPEGQAKPNQPKETMLAQIRANRVGTPTPAYCKIASSVSLRGCSDASFDSFRNQLQTWFP
jgi:hypothetical protein